MIVRVWRAPVAAEDVEPFQRFMRENLFPLLRSSDVCRSMTVAVDHEQDPPRVLAVSTWRSHADLDELLGGGPGSDVFFEEAERFLAGPPEVDHHEVLDHETW